MKQIIIAVIAIVGIIVGATLLGNGKDIVTAEPSNNFYGAENGVITVTEYGDFQCPACAGFLPIFTQVKEQFKDQVRFEFKHFPLVQIHPNSTAAHRAAQAAANQDKFWEMHDVLYQRQQSWNETTNPSAIFTEYAREIGLDMDQYANEVSLSETLAVINADVAKGKELGANSTPTFYIDGVKIEDLTPISTVEGFSAAIQDAINAKSGTSSSEAAPSSDSEIPTPPKETETE